MLKWIDYFLNRITMYRLVLYCLIFLLGAAVVLSAFKILPFAPLTLVFSTVVLVALCWVVNKIFARVFRVQANVESIYITALILALIISPPSARHYFATFGFLLWAATWAMASKYILAIKKKHIFNPAAFAVALTALTINQSASWWVGTAWMLPFVAIVLFLLARKVQRIDAVLMLIMVALVTIVGGTFTHINPLTMVYNVIVSSPLLFFAGVMFTEPLTMPPTRIRQVLYGALVGFLFAPPIHFGSFYLTPELALLLGNVFSYLVSPKGRYVLRFAEKQKIAAGVYNFVFQADQKIQFRPGQYLEWTLGHKHTDSRGNRRYFTIASSPTENKIILGVKFYDQPSSFKAKMLAMNPGETILASQLAGDFVLPKDPQKKLAFIAGGIGITPYRSMLKYLLDRKEKRSIVTLYASKTLDEIAYYDILEQAAKQLGIETVFTLTDKTKIAPHWDGYTGHISAAMIAEQIPDYRQRIFYISGPQPLVDASKDLLKSMGLPRQQIKTDFFPGLV